MKNQCKIGIFLYIETQSDTHSVLIPRVSVVTETYLFHYQMSDIPQYQKEEM